MVDACVSMRVAYKLKAEDTAFINKPKKYWRIYKDICSFVKYFFTFDSLFLTFCPFLV